MPPREPKTVLQRLVSFLVSALLLHILGRGAGGESALDLSPTLQDNFVPPGVQQVPAAPGEDR